MTAPTKTDVRGDAAIPAAPRPPATSSIAAMAVGQSRMARALTLPALIVIALTILIPVVIAFIFSFTKYNLIQPPQWIGFDNYIALFTDPVFGKSVLNTLYFAIGQVIIGVVVAMFVALLFSQKLHGGAGMRTIVYLPQAMSYVTVALLWAFLYDPQNGPINAVLHMVGLGPINFLTSTSLAMPSIIAMSLWRNLGYFMIILLAGLNAVPDQYLEAAQIDGAGWWRRFWYVIIPEMSSPIFFVVVTWLLGGLQMFTQAYVMTQGGPVNATRTVVYAMYQDAFTALNIGQASAIVVLMFVGVMAVAIPIRMIQGLRERRLRNG